MPLREKKHHRRYLEAPLFWGLMGWLLTSALQPCLAQAQDQPNLPPLLQADKLTYDENANIVTAIGNVEVAHDEQVLRADKIIYNRTTGVVRAMGNIALTNQKSGEIIFAKQMEITADMKEGFVDQVGILFLDNSRMIANDAQRYEGRYLITDHGVYTACDLCKDDPRKAPLWQVKGARVTHDSEAKDVIYRDAVVEFDGVPVFYTPYFSHPDPSVKRRQGFLAPTVGSKSTLGFMAKTPYYFDLAPQSDLLLTPTFSVNDKIQMAANWRHRFENGTMNWTGSIVRADLVNEFGTDKGQNWRGHIFGDTSFVLNEEWRAGTKIEYASDKSYLPRYDISSQDILTDRAYVERFAGRNYVVGEAMYFKDMRPGSRPDEPIVAPEIRYSAFGEPNETLGGRWSLNSSLLVTSRSDDPDLAKRGPSTRRLSLEGGWQRQLISDTGFLTTVSGLARTDSYWAENVADPKAAAGTSFSSVEKTRPFVQGDVQVRYPLARQGSGYQQILEPIGVFTAAPRVNNRQILPNEDSLDVEFDESNLFLPSRFTGVDRVEGGMRSAYGLRHALFGDNGMHIDMVGGQVFRFNRDSYFTKGTGLSQKFSDYVGRVEFVPSTYVSGYYSFRLDEENLNLTRQKFNLSAGVPLFRPSVQYLNLKQTENTTNIDERLEELTGGIESHFAKFYSITASHSQSFKPSPGPRSTAVAFTYQDECFKASLSGSKDYTDRADLKEGTKVLFTFYLKNIGGIDTNR